MMSFMEKVNIFSKLFIVSLEEAEKVQKAIHAPIPDELEKWRRESKTQMDYPICNANMEVKPKLSIFFLEMERREICRG